MEVRKMGSYLPGSDARCISLREKSRNARAVGSLRARHRWSATTFSASTRPTPFPPVTGPTRVAVIAATTAAAARPTSATHQEEIAMVIRAPAHHPTIAGPATAGAGLTPRASRGQPKVRLRIRRGRQRDPSVGRNPDGLQASGMDTSTRTRFDCVLPARWDGRGCIRRSPEGRDRVCGLDTCMRLFVLDNVIGFAPHCGNPPPHAAPEDGVDREGYGRMPRSTAL